MNNPGTAPKYCSFGWVAQDSRDAQQTTCTRGDATAYAVALQSPLQYCTSRTQQYRVLYRMMTMRHLMSGLH